MRRTLLLISLALLAPAARAQSQQAPRTGAEVVDKMVAVVNGRELITHTDLLWQLALQPGVPIESPREEDLRRALDLLIDQRLISQEAEKLPSVAPTSEEIAAELKRLIGLFPSQSEFYARLARVGLGEDSTQLREIVQERVRISKYLDFRFRSFTVVTPQEVAEYYRDVYVPRRRRQAPGVVVPKLEDAYNEIQSELMEAKIESGTDEFLEEARSAAEITILD
ncbi:MAG TPA: hypothetical protein VD968_15445 [Pyrinomonadaceae bacterium]|nr:hypothetical protein [Pyrinomonadaceae bacterium]